MTIREDAAMLEHVPRFVEPERPDESRTLVRTPAGEELDVSIRRWPPRSATDVRVIKQDRGVFDAMPLSLITTQAIAELEGLVGFGLDPQRFRPNLLVEATSARTRGSGACCGSAGWRCGSTSETSAA